MTLIEMSPFSMFVVIGFLFSVIGFIGYRLLHISQVIRSKKMNSTPKK